MPLPDNLFDEAPKKAGALPDDLFDEAPPKKKPSLVSTIGNLPIAPMMNPGFLTRKAGLSLIHI